MLQTSRQGGNRHRCRRDARTQASSLKNEMLFHVVYFTLRDFFDFLFIFLQRCRTEVNRRSYFWAQAARGVANYCVRHPPAGRAVMDCPGGIPALLGEGATKHRGKNLFSNPNQYKR